MGVFDSASKKIHNLLGLTALGQTTKAGSLPVTIASDQDVSLVDDAAFTTAVSRVLPVGGVYQSVPDAVNAGDVGAFRVNARRAQIVAGESLFTATFAASITSAAYADAYNVEFINMHSGKLGSADGSTYGTESALWLPLGIKNFNSFSVGVVIGTTGFDTAVTVNVYTGREITPVLPLVYNNRGALLASLTIPSGGATMSFEISGSQTAYGGTVGTATAADGALYRVQTTPATPSIIIQFVGAGTPTVGTFARLFVGRGV